MALIMLQSTQPQKLSLLHAIISICFIREPGGQLGSADLRPGSSGVVWLCSACPSFSSTTSRLAGQLLLMARTETDRVRGTHKPSQCLGSYVAHLCVYLLQVGKASHVAELKSRNGGKYASSLIGELQNSQHRCEQG